MSKLEFLEEKLRWQEEKIKDLEDERDFLRGQLKNKGMIPDPANEDIKFRVDDSSSESSGSPGISDSSESDKAYKKAKKRRSTWTAKHFHARAQSPEEVITRYRKVLKTFQRVRTMTEAFNRHNVDRGTIAFTAAIAELAIVDPKMYESLAAMSTKETLAAFSKKCAAHINEETKNKIEDMKAKGQLLPIRWK
ncbi:coiled-coil domain-containing protein 106-like [Astyanax mexicanus]|uniref:Coiled-coil domain-containing protein 106-like n=1 Tax=Astyanax mexicanus TaxID=7994 RepID=A0A8T2L7L0_ASTMX|nr:coiled-coil domain-containing protein 106-like [Astyanax mexicanus]